MPLSYTLTKIHKPTPVGRSIISGFDGPTENIDGPTENKSTDDLSVHNDGCGTLYIDFL